MDIAFLIVIMEFFFSKEKSKHCLICTNQIKLKKKT